MLNRAALGVLLFTATANAASAADSVKVKGSRAEYPTAVKLPVKDGTIQLNLTGAGLRTRIGFGVYAVASYVQDGTACRTAEDVVKADATRLLHLVMSRTVEPADFIDAFKSAVGKSYPADKFAKEFQELTTAVGNKAAAKGEHVFLISEPRVGVRIRIADKVDVTIKNPEFAKALWEVYLGARPIDAGLKQELVSMLPRR